MESGGTLSWRNHMCACKSALIIGNFPVNTLLCYISSTSLFYILRAQYKPSAYLQLPSSVPVGYLAPIPILVVSDQILIIAVIIIPSQTEEASALRMGALSPFVQARHQCQLLTELFGNLDHHHCHHRCHHSLSLSMVPDTRRL